MTGDGTPAEISLGTADPRGQAPASKLDPGLYVVATPIGNLGDLSRRAVDVLAAVDLVACEDSRVSGRLLAHAGLRRPLIVYNDHSAARVRPAILARLAAGERVALVSDAGTPAISDPGYRLIREAQDAGVPVRAVPGPSAVLAALSVAGLPTDRFLFLGFLPPRESARRRALAEVAGLQATLVILESPNRLAATLADALALLGPREAAVARELTKLFEEVRRDALAALARHYAAAPAPRGEIVLLIGPPPARAAAIDEAEIDEQLRLAVRSLPPRQAAAAVARSTGLPKNALYDRLLQLRRTAAEWP